MSALIRHVRQLEGVVVLVGTTVAIAGCGQAAVPPQRVQLSVGVPTDGSTVVVRGIYVLGTVAPADAVVAIDGRPVALHGGRFRQPLTLRAGLNDIRIEGSARGYRGTVNEVRVRYDRPRSLAAGPARSSVGIRRGSSFVARANHVCQSADNAVAALPAMLTPATALSDASAVQSMMRRYLAELQALVADGPLASAFAAFIASEQRESGVFDQAMASLRAGNRPEAAQLILRLAKMGRQSDALATSMGLDACAATPIPGG